ncbi:CocE/NonD family hydrolase [Frigidibacter sp.]|uniref:CocE/NonD family hydrolase n=1 Tax=Frigidibacter sp. TaxID=2586418 RepID=UPI002733668D|nr:CocE/NonD family hydrolase [Frigidibacter sp.]MDP3342197.1 CocE/NonD family hydrolase [Frigidibacter sp.]
MSGIEFTFRKTRPADHPKARYPGLRPTQKRFSKGEQVAPGALPLLCDIVMDQDVAVTLRDGKRIYVDIFRPADHTQPLPTLVNWGPYGKQGGVIAFEDLPFRGGVTPGMVSGLEMFEGADPAYWCAHGYAVVNVDAPGTMSSEGDIHCWGRQEGRDGHDLVEWVGAQSWSNGKVGLTGTSWLAIVQWFIAAEQPPHLAAISPCEGWTDLYRTDVVRGGIPDFGFNDHMLSMFAGPGGVEDVPAIGRTDTLMNDYWRDKIPDLGKIEVPAYVISSWTNLIHAIGTFNGWCGLASAQKWLRVHNSHEWAHYYTEVDDLRRFFDRFLKGDQNGWDETPPVRLAVLDPGGEDILDRAEADFPLPRTVYTPLYLDAATGTMAAEAPAQAAFAEYDPADKTSRAVFTHRFDRDTEIVGYLKAQLWVEAKEADDLDLYVEVRKLDADGRHLGCWTFLPPGKSRDVPPDNVESQPGMFVFSGAKGMQRASLRAVDPALSGPARPHHTYDRTQKLAPGEVVPVDVQIWPLGMRWSTGQQIQLVIAGQKLSGAEFPGLAGPDTVNRGRHVIHTGAEHGSYLMLPVTG